MSGVSLPTETIFTMETTPIKFGLGATEEVGYELKRLGVQRPLILADPGLMKVGLPERVRHLAEADGVAAEIFDGVHVEPTDQSFEAAAEYARSRDVDGFVAVGGGSAIDTAKAANLLTTHPAPLLDYVNKPIGAGAPVPGPLKPLVAIPTTAGTGSETTAVAVMDILELRLKSGISHRYLRPSVGIVDPLNTLSLPPAVTAASGMDVLTHALESYTSRPFNARPRHAAAERPTYVGANPISDLWCERAIEWVGRYLRRAVLNGDDVEARTHMALAATAAGVGFGNAGVHIPHAVAYPIAGMVRDYFPPGYGSEEPMVPHGVSVVITAPAAFRFTYPTSPERHLRAAQLLSGGVTEAGTVDGAEALPKVLLSLMRDIGIPNGVSALGYGEPDLSGLVDGALKQQRLLAGAPRLVEAAALETVLLDAMRYW